MSRDFRTETDRQIEFTLPESIKDFVFDLYQATRRSLQIEEVQLNYDSRFRELTEKYFNNSAWPEPAAIAPECNDDEVFLLLYREMTLRHVFIKLKPQLGDYIASWINFSKLFAYLMKDTSGPNSQIALSVQWGYDIVQEFLYQFQSFCQFRTPVTSRSPEELEMLQANRDVWTLPSVLAILNGLIRISKIVEIQNEKSSSITGSSVVSVPTSALSILGYFSLIELARLECLMGDYTASLLAAAPIRLWDRSELFVVIPNCHVSLFYHTGLCQLLSRRYADAIETFSDIILHISRLIKPGAGGNRQSLLLQMQKMLDKLLALVSISMSLCPGYRVDDLVRELAENKYDERLRRLQAGDLATFEGMLEISSPKFICPAVPDYSTPVNLGQDVYRLQISLFISDISHQVSLLRLRSYMRLYTSIDLPKLARFNDMTVSDLTCQLMSFHHKTTQIHSSQLGGEKGVRASTSDVHFHIQDGVLFVDASSEKSDRGRAAERVFISGIRKHVEISEEINRIFGRYGL